MLRFSFVILLFLFNSVIISAQTWEIGGFAGGSGYMGDLNPVSPYKVNNIAYSGIIKRNFDPYWSVKLSFLHGKIEAADSESKNEQFKNRNLSFFSPVNELSLQLEFNFFNYIPSISKKRYSPYLFVGFGTVAFNPQASFQNNNYELNLYATEGQDLEKTYKTYSLTIPYGTGIKYNITGKWNLIGEIGYRTAYTDYLDDVSGTYPDKNNLSNITAISLSDRSGEISGNYSGISGTQRGDFRARDTYMFMGIGLTYTFINPKCYSF